MTSSLEQDLDKIKLGASMQQGGCWICGKKSTHLWLYAYVIRRRCYEHRVGEELTTKDIFLLKVFNIL